MQLHPGPIFPKTTLMRISTTFLTVCAAALSLLPVSLRAAADSESQAKVREALRQKLQELNSQSTPAAQPPTAAQTPAAQPPAEQPKVIPPPTTPPAVQPPPVETSAQAQPAQVKPEPPPAQAKTKPAKQPKVKPAPPAETTPFAETQAPVVVNTPKARPEDIERQREALRKQIEDLNARQPGPPVVTVPSAGQPPLTP